MYVYKNKKTGLYLKWNDKDADLNNCNIYKSPLDDLYGLNKIVNDFSDYIECDLNKEIRKLKLKNLLK